MLEDRIELIDSDDSTIKDSRLSSNQLKFKPESYRINKKRWLAELNEKLNRMKNNLVSSEYSANSFGIMSPDGEKAILSKTKAIAKLEKLIKVLLKESVPNSYVRNRAIKLKEKMMENVIYNTNSAYSVREEDYDKVFENDSIGKVASVSDYFKGDDFERVAAAGHTDDIDLTRVVDGSERLASQVDKALGTTDDSITIPSISEDDIKDVIDGQLSDVDTKEASSFEDSDVTSSIPEDDIKDVIDDQFSDVDAKEASSFEDSDVTSSIPEDDIKDVIDGQFSDVDTKEASSFEGSNATSSISEYDSKDAVKEPSPTSEAVEPVTIEVGDSPKVSRNGSSVARVDRFDTDGKRRKYEYTPMSDEEIAKARENIEYDKYEEKYHNDTPSVTPPLVIPKVSFKDVFTPIDTKNIGIGDSLISVGDDTQEAIREVPIIAPERSDNGTYGKDGEKPVVEESASVISAPAEENSAIQDFHFDYSEATEKDVAQASTIETSLSGLEALKERALRLKEENQQSKRELDEARREQSDVALRALEAKKAKEEKRQSYEAALQKLRDYCEALEEDTKINRSDVAIAQTDRDCNRRFIENQEAEIDSYAGLMEEIDSIISPEATNPVVRK